MDEVPGVSAAVRIWIALAIFGLLWLWIWWLT